MPSLSHQTESLDKPNKALPEAKGTPLSVRIAGGQAELLEDAFEYGEGDVGTGGVHTGDMGNSLYLRYG
ncbi:hypothetical protein N1F89_20635, partial [Aquibium sp. A9E412]|uniref:hypothetical protein n=1 Tax=Aquibium sp. A9E412 TaxID=2976767 RepID=UPI0025AED19A